MEYDRISIKYLTYFWFDFPTEWRLKLLLWLQRRRRMLAMLFNNAMKTLQNCFAKRRNSRHFFYVFTCSIIQSGGLTDEHGGGGLSVCHSHVLRRLPGEHRCLQRRSCLASGCPLPGFDVSVPRELPPTTTTTPAGVQSPGILRRILS